MRVRIYIADRGGDHHFEKEHKVWVDIEMPYAPKCDDPIYLSKKSKDIIIKKMIKDIDIAKIYFPDCFIGYDIPEKLTEDNFEQIKSMCTVDNHFLVQIIAYEEEEEITKILLG